MSENVVRQAATALAVKNHLIMSIIYTFGVRSAHICRQFSGSLSCSIGQVIPLLAYIVRYFIVSHQLGCSKRNWTTIFYYHLHIVPISQRFKIMFVSQRGKKKKKRETWLANEWSVWIRGQNQMLQLVALSNGVWMILLGRSDSKQASVLVHMKTSEWGFLTKFALFLTARKESENHECRSSFWKW